MIKLHKMSGYLAHLYHYNTVDSVGKEHAVTQKHGLLSFVTSSDLYMLSVVKQWTTTRNKHIRNELRCLGIRMSERPAKEVLIGLR